MTMKKIFILLMLSAFADLLGNNTTAIENSNGEKKTNQPTTEVKKIDNDKLNRYINKYKDSNINYRQMSENTTIYDVDTIPLKQALKEGIWRPWLKHHASKISNPTRDPDTNLQLFFEQNSDKTDEVKQFAIDNKELDLLKFLAKHVDEFDHTNLEAMINQK